MLQRGKRSIAPALGGVCSACDHPLPAPQLARLHSCKDLEGCDNCGTFLYFERARETRAAAEYKPAAAKGERLKAAMA